MKRFFVLLLGLWCGACRCSLLAQAFPYQNPQLPTALRVADLLGCMSLEEKIGQLNLLSYHASTDSAVRENVRAGRFGALLKANGASLCRSLQLEAVESSRWGIPLMFHEDVIHGYRTIQPWSMPHPLRTGWTTALGIA